MRLLTYLLIIIAFLSCKSNENKQETSGKDSINTNTVKTEYTCPMHSEVVSDKPGQCPQCGMDLEAKI